MSYKFKIMDKSWEIFEVDAKNYRLFTGDHALGTCHIQERKIYLADNLSKERKREVLLHELSHAFLSCTQINYKETLSEEELCDFVAFYASGILDVANDYFEGGRNETSET